MWTHAKTLLSWTLLATAALAKTDNEGCTSFVSVVTVRPEPGFGNTYSTMIWYMTDNLEICEGVDCGGGRAPLRTVPGCPLYTGTETVTPRFLASDPMKPTPTSPSETDGKTEETGSFVTAASVQPTPGGGNSSTEGEGSAKSGEGGGDGSGNSQQAALATAKTAATALSLVIRLAVAMVVV